MVPLESGDAINLAAAQTHTVQFGIQHFSQTEGGGAVLAPEQPCDEAGLPSYESDVLGRCSSEADVGNTSPLRPPIMWGTISDFEFHGYSDWGIKISKVDDENYQVRQSCCQC